MGSKQKRLKIMQKQVAVAIAWKLDLADREDFSPEVSIMDHGNGTFRVWLYDSDRNCIHYDDYKVVPA